MRTSPTTTRRKDFSARAGIPRLKSARPGFTLIEVTIVVGIIAMMAVMVLPKGFFSLEPPLRELQRTVTEITDLALDGYTVRLRMEAADRTDRGYIVAEALTKVEDRFDPAKHTLEWKPFQPRHPLKGAEWRLEPEIVYFYSDGSCTPARILRADRDIRITEGESTLLTVTGFLFEANNRN
ncbi:MAG: type II secretion system GspH family protein [Synergistaceae bacterium]|jgi:prepilin-type N-terminal cleavage/methylation domain-containing protein|nr:type II secretion system GspH family protein [Synergistaceae bacterium]